MSGGGQLLSGVLNLAAAFTGNWWYFAASVGVSYYDAKRDQRKAIRKYNESLTDRLEMVERDPRLARTRCYGRVRNTEGAHRPFTHGPNEQDLAFFVSIAGHEIDGIEQWYFNDTPITLSGTGYVTTSPWTRSDIQTESVSRTGDGTVSLPDDYITGTAKATFQIGSGEDSTGLTASVSVSGTGPYTATVSGSGGATVFISYARFVGNSYARVRPYLGTATQSIGGELAAEFPGKLTTDDHCRGVAGGWIDLSYSEDVFPTGRPTVTALFRGAKVYDPRKDSTVSGGSGSHRIGNAATWEWSRNPALIAYDWARYRWGMNVNSSLINVQDVMTAANACDVSTVFTLRMPDTSTTTVTLPRFQCDMVIPTDADPEDAMDRIVATMGGRWCWSGGVLRMRAGTLNTSVASVDDSWLMEKVDSSGSPSGEPVVTAAQTVTRAQRWNRISGSCIDPDKRYQLLPYPAVEDAVLIAAKGERELEVDFDSVSSIAQAQHLASMAIRKAQAGQRLEMRCGLKAMDLELLDVFTLTYQSTRHNISAKTYEVIGWKFDLSEGITIQAEEISAALFTVDAELTGRDPAPDSDIRQPWDVEQLQNLAADGNDATVLDGSMVTKLVVTWDLPVGSSILQSGYTEIQYTNASEAVPADEDWITWTEPASTGRAVITGPLSGLYYLVRARFVQRIPLVRGQWNSPPLRVLIGKPPDSNATVNASGANSITGPHNSAATFTGDIVTASYTNPLGREIRVRIDAACYGIFLYVESLLTTRKIKVNISGAVSDNGDVTLTENMTTPAVNGPPDAFRVLERSIAAGGTLTVKIQRQTAVASGSVPTAAELNASASITITAFLR